MTRASSTLSVGSTYAVLFGSLFTAQASLVVLSPILPQVAADLQVTTAAAGQLRAVSGLAAAAVAVAILRAGCRRGLLDVLAGGLGLILLGTTASAFAPTFLALAAAQIILGAGVALTLTGGLTATAVWIPADSRGRALSWALLGQPAAWIIGLPLAGVLGDRSWRLAWLVPLAAGAATLAAVLHSHRHPSAAPAAARSSPARRAEVLTWAAAELLAYAGWTGVLVYVGALFAQAYGTSIGTTGVLLGVGALAYLPGNLIGRRWVDRAARPMSIWLATVMAMAELLLTTTRPSLGFSLAAFASFAFLGGARTIAGSALGLQLGSTDPFSAMSLRTASVHFGYLAGAGLGGIGLAMAGFNGLGAVLSVLLALSATLLLTGGQRLGAAAYDFRNGPPAVQPVPGPSGGKTAGPMVGDRTPRVACAAR
jgi:DHA1 family inner membrane transport protein